MNRPEVFVAVGRARFENERRSPYQRASVSAFRSEKRVSRRPRPRRARRPGARIVPESAVGRCGPRGSHTAAVGAGQPGRADIRVRGRVALRPHRNPRISHFSLINPK